MESISKWFNDLLDPNSSKSSARFLNIFGGVIFGSVYVADFIMQRKFNVDATEILALYYAGVYGTSGVISWARGKLDLQKGNTNG